ncbi:MAG: orotidine-5'-phosphate decarboxylase [Longimicrobiales bacterium]|nr:orotidine-5'-phosphate decarboxylase [Longimicrobiales bacterium]
MSQLVVALDLPSGREALELVDRLGDEGSFYKVGLELYTREGPGLVRALKGRGCSVFLDLKLHDIPHTVERAAAAAADLGVDLLTVHATGGSTMLEAAVRGVRASGAGTRTLAVTLLTSLSAAEIEAVWGRTLDSIRDEVLRLAAAARAAGADGVVASALEARDLRRTLGAEALLVTPGIRLAGGEHHDQSRVATPAVAVEAGATHLVVGRPITGAADPRAALLRVRSEIASATPGSAR